MLALCIIRCSEYSVCSRGKIEQQLLPLLIFNVRIIYDIRVYNQVTSETLNLSSFLAEGEGVSCEGFLWFHGDFLVGERSLELRPVVVTFQVALCTIDLPI